MPRQLTIRLSQIPSTAQEIALSLKGDEILALIGPLGAGKTTFVQNLAKYLKIKAKITSPTFVFFHRFEGRLKRKKVELYHFDLYRAKSFKEVKALGLEEIWNRPGHIAAIEWADKIKKYLPKNSWIINFEK